MAKELFARYFSYVHSSPVVIVQVVSLSKGVLAPLAELTDPLIVLLHRLHKRGCGHLLPEQ